MTLRTLGGGLDILWAPRPVVRRLSVLSGGDGGWIWHRAVDGLRLRLLTGVPDDHLTLEGRRLAGRVT